MATRTATRTRRRHSNNGATSTSTGDDVLPPMIWTPTRLFFASGAGVHETQRGAMQRAMREAGVGECNLVKVSSVIPPGCEIITRARGLRMLRPGGIVHAVIAQGETNEPYQRITPAICWAQPDDPARPGYVTEIEEDHSRGRSTESSTEEAGVALITITGERLGVRVDGKKLWSHRGRSQRVRIGRTSYRVGSLAESREGAEAHGGQPMFTVAVVVGVFL
jgi:arginine decarboxylase